MVVSNNVLLKPRRSAEFFELLVTSWIWFHLSALLVSQHCADSNSGRRNALRHSYVMTCTPRPASSTATTTWSAGKPAPPLMYAVLERCSNLMSQCHFWANVHALFCQRMHVFWETFTGCWSSSTDLSCLCNPPWALGQSHMAAWSSLLGNCGKCLNVRSHKCTQIFITCDMILFCENFCKYWLY